MVEGLLVVAGAGLTLLVGLPLVGRFADPLAGWAWLRNAPPPVPERPKLDLVRAFDPLDLGPDPVQWPSEHPWAVSPIPDPPWPSQTWDDEHFGAHWRKARPGHASREAHDHGVAAEAADRLVEAGAAVSQLAQQLLGGRDPENAPSGAPTPLATPTAPAKKGKPKAKPAEDQASRVAAAAKVASELLTGVSVVAEEVSRSRAAPASPPPTRAQQAVAVAGAVEKATRGLPAREELERMVAEIGLAGTVQKLMEQTGWDFRQAAQYLARTRQGR